MATYVIWVKGEPRKLENVKDFHFDTSAPFVTFRSLDGGLPPIASFDREMVTKILREDQLSQTEKDAIIS